MSALWEKFDGPGAPARVSARLGLEGTAAPKRFGQWGEVEVTAADYATLWKYVLDDMPAADRELLTTDMAAAPSTAKDGFDQGFGLLSSEIRGDGAGAVAKQGWMCCFSGRYYLHSAGVLGPDEPLRRGAAHPPAADEGLAGGPVGADRDRDEGGRGAALTPLVGGVCEPRRDDRTGVGGGSAAGSGRLGPGAAAAGPRARRQRTVSCR